MTRTTSNYERRRLQALKEYAVMDTMPEQAYDDFTRLVVTICQVPIALISLVDEHRQWFKSRVGLDTEETRRDIAFCEQTILGAKVMVVPDAAADSRFAANPLVTREPGIRFYAGAPLITPDGYGIGALCAIDREPRTLSQEQTDALAALARRLMGQLELRRVSRHLADALAQIRAMEGLIPICSYCKNIRNDRGFWSSVEAFMAENSSVTFTHGICPDCMKKQFGLDADAVQRE